MDVYVAVIGQLVLAGALVIWALRRNRRERRPDLPAGEGARD